MRVGVGGAMRVVIERAQAISRGEGGVVGFQH